jgi:Ulp1 family protease
MERSVIGKDGKKVVCIATLPGREYFSDDIEDAIFDDAKCEPPYVDWTLGATERLSASPACAKRYKKYFSAKNQESVKGNTVTAKVGKNALRARDLDTLKPEEWLNDQVIDVMTQVWASRAIMESTREVAVFDTQFTKLILERPRGSEAEYYVYDRVVGYAEKRLLGKSPTKFDCLLFPNGINRNHWTIMAVFPKQRMIVCLDSLFDGNIKDARTIFRWLYDEIRYNHPEDENTLFQPFQQDLGWKYTTDKLLKVQNDMDNCGVFLVGFIHCLLFRINPRHLTHALMAEYRKRIFDELHGAKVKVYGPSPWIQHNPVKCIQKSLPPLPDAI